MTSKWTTPCGRILRTINNDSVNESQIFFFNLCRSSSRNEILCKKSLIAFVEFKTMID